MPLACFMAGALGLTFGTRFEPRTVPILFGVIVLPLTFLGAIYYSWAALEPIRWLQIAVLVNPLVYMSEGFRAALTPAEHMSLWADLRRADRLHRAVHVARDRRLQAARAELSRRRCGQRRVGVVPGGRWLSSSSVSGGVHLTFYGVRGSTPCDGARYQRYGGNTSCVALEADGPRPARSSTSAPACASTATSSPSSSGRAAREPAREPVPRHGAAHPPPLGPHPGAAVLHAGVPARRGDRRLRPAPGGRPARRGVHRRDAAAVLPDHARAARRHGHLPRHRPRRLRGQRRQGALAVGAPHRPDARVPRRARGHVGHLHLRPRPGLRPRRPRRLRPRRRCSSSATASTCSSTTPSTPRTSTRRKRHFGHSHDRLRGARRA